MKRRSAKDWKASGVVSSSIDSGRGYTGNTTSRIMTGRNPNQGEYKKVLCVCMGGILRSATAAVIFSQPPYNFNTRAAGIDPEIALVPVDQALVSWADEIVCMEAYQAMRIMKHFKTDSQRIIVLNVPDIYEYRSPKLIARICDAYDRHYFPEKAVQQVAVQPRLDGVVDFTQPDSFYDDPADDFNIDDDEEWPSQVGRYPYVDPRYVGAPSATVNEPKPIAVQGAVKPTPVTDRAVSGEWDTKTTAQKQIDEWVKKGKVTTVAGDAAKSHLGTDSMAGKLDKAAAGFAMRD